MEPHYSHLNEPAKHMLDGLSVVTVLGTLMNILPSIAALFTIVWTAIRIWETRTVRSWFGRVREGDKEDA